MEFDTLPQQHECLSLKFDKERAACPSNSHRKILHISPGQEPPNFVAAVTSGRAKTLIVLLREECLQDQIILKRCSLALTLLLCFSCSIA